MGVIMFLICISQTASEGEHLFMRLLAFWVTSIVHLISSFFPIWLILHVFFSHTEYFSAHLHSWSNILHRFGRLHGIANITWDRVSEDFGLISSSITS